jgi:hypothetical protein
MLIKSAGPPAKERHVSPLALHPGHLADLNKSGLTDETIRAAAIYTVNPDEIGKKLGGLANGVVSALAFPYPGHDGFERYKVWWEEERQEKAPKYLQKGGTLSHLYFSPGIDLAGDTPLLITEGEKKCLALWQTGYQVLGIGGVWNWLTKGENGESRPIADLALVNWKRSVAIIFDSDGHDNPLVRLAAWRLARELAGRGATVNVLFLPHGQNEQKQGADDYLMAHGPEALADLLTTSWPYDPALNDHEAEIYWHLRGITSESATFDKLKALAPLAPILSKMAHLEAAAVLEGLKDRLKLRAKDLNDLTVDMKAARKKSNQDGGQATALTDLGDVRRLHPAIDFHGDFMTVGFRVDLPDNDAGLLLVISDGEGVKVEVDPETIKMGEQVYQVKPGAPPFLKDVWGLETLKSFMAHPTYPMDLFIDLVAAYKAFLDLPGPAYGLMAAWTVGTYYAHQFTAYPFLQFHGPKESGKSKSLEALRCVCFNAWKGRDISPAALGDTADGQRGTLLLDQAEKLNNEKETGNLIGLLADSYKKAGGQRRVVEVTKAGRSVLEFSTYGPKAFASTKNLDPDLRDRCVRVAMTRTRKRLPDLEGWEPIWGKLRDKLYRFALSAFKAVQAHYEAIQGDGTRIGELWRPMLAVLKALGVEQGEIETIRVLFMEAAEENRHELDPWESILFEVLKERAESETAFEMTVDEILETMGIEGDRKPGVWWIGNALSKFSLFSKRLPRRYADESRKRKVQPYLFDPAHVLKIYEIYNRDTPPNEASQASQGENYNESNRFCGTNKNAGTCPEASQEGPQEGLGRNETCPEKAKCPTEVIDLINYSDVGRMGRSESAGMSEKKSQIYVGDEVDPFGGEI